jgi:hypothetical protein
MKPGTLMKYYDRVAMIIREAGWDDIITAHSKGLSNEAVWTYKSGVITYWIVLIEEQLYLVNGDVLKSLEVAA